MTISPHSGDLSQLHYNISGEFFGSCGKKCGEEAWTHHMRRHVFTHVVEGSSAS